MVTLLFATIAEASEEAFSAHYLNAIDAERRAKATAYKPEHARRLNIAAGCLMQVGARLYNGGLDSDLLVTGTDGVAALSYDDFLVLYDTIALGYAAGEYGKPQFTKGCDAFFSLSHSKDAVAVAIGDEVMGVDVQHHRPTHYERIAARFFAPEEVRFLHEIMSGTKVPVAGLTPLHAFHDLWAAKEAYVKFTGDGIFLPFDQFTVQLTYEAHAPLKGSVVHEDEDAALLYPVMEEDYSYCLCTKEPAQVNVLKVTFPAALP